MPESRAAGEAATRAWQQQRAGAGLVRLHLRHALLPAARLLPPCRRVLAVCRWPRRQSPLCRDLSELRRRPQALRPPAAVVESAAGRGPAAARVVRAVRGARGGAATWPPYYAIWERFWTKDIRQSAWFRKTGTWLPSTRRVTWPMSGQRTLPRAGGCWRPAWPIAKPIGNVRGRGCWRQAFQYYEASALAYLAGTRDRAGCRRTPKRMRWPPWMPPCAGWRWPTADGTWRWRCSPATPCW